LQFSMPLYNSQIYGAIKTTKIASELSDLQYILFIFKTIKRSGFRK